MVNICYPMSLCLYSPLPFFLGLTTQSSPVCYCTLFCKIIGFTFFYLTVIVATNVFSLYQWWLFSFFFSFSSDSFNGFINFEKFVFFIFIFFENFEWIVCYSKHVVAFTPLKVLVFMTMYSCQMWQKLICKLVFWKR